jgi:hypothetical protein
MFMGLGDTVAAADRPDRPALLRYFCAPRLEEMMPERDHRDALVVVMTEVARSPVLRRSVFNAKGHGVARLLVETGGGDEGGGADDGDEAEERAIPFHFDDFSKSAYAWRASVLWGVAGAPHVELCRPTACEKRPVLANPYP